MKLRNMNNRNPIAYLIALIIVIISVYCLHSSSDQVSKDKKMNELETVEYLDKCLRTAEKIEGMSPEDKLECCNKVLSYLNSNWGVWQKQDKLRNSYYYIYKSIGEIKAEQGNHLESIESNNLATLYCPNQECEHELYLLIGQSYLSAEYFTEAQEAFSLADSIVSDHHLALDKPELNYYLGKVYWHLSENSIAESYLKSYLQAENEQLPSDQYIESIFLLAEINRHKLEKRQAEQYYNQALEAGIKSANHKLDGGIYEGLAELYRHGSDSQSPYYYQKARTFWQQAGNQAETIRIDLSRIAYWQNSSQPESARKAKEILDLYIDYEDQITSDELKSSYLLLLSEAEKAEGRDKSAYNLKVDSYAISDSLREELEDKKIRKLERLINHKSIIAENRYKTEKRIGMDRICYKRNRVNIIMILILFILLAVIITIVSIMIVQRGRQNRIEAINQEISKQNDQLQKRILELGSFKKELKRKYRQAILEVRKKDSILIIQSRYAALSDMIENIVVQWKRELQKVETLVDELSHLQGKQEITESEIKPIVQSSMQILHQMSKRIDDFRNYFKPHKEKVSFNVKDTIEKTVRFVESYYSLIKIKIESDQLDDNIKLEAYPNELSLVLLNILNNSREVFIRNKTVEPRINVSLKSQFSRVILEVSDNGGGMDSEQLSEMFEPFFTTKADKLACGLGLYIAKDIITHRFNGKITAKNQAGGLLVKIII